MKNKKTLIASISILSILSSCTGTNYKRYIAPMYESVINKNITDNVIKQVYDDIDMFIIDTLSDANKQIGPKNYKYNVTVLEDRDQLNEFYTKVGNYIDKDEEIKKYEINMDNSSLVYIMAQIPKGYKLLDKKENIQSIIDNKEMLVSKDFYYYQKDIDRPYSILDIEKNDEIENDSIYSFFYRITSTFKINLSQKTIKVMYNIITGK